MKKVVLLVAAVCALLAGCSAGVPTLSIAAASALERRARLIIERDAHIAPLPVKDDAAALSQLRSGACDAALVSADTELPGGVTRVCGLAAGVLHAVSGVADIGAWRGLTVAVMAGRDTDEAAMLLALLESYYIKSGDTRLIYLAPEDMENALDDGRADAALLFAPLGDALVERLLKYGALCDIPQAKRNMLTAQFDALVPADIPEGAYGGGASVGTLALPALLVMRADADEDLRARMLAAAGQATEQ